jgi:predicted dehydrogenase
MAVIRFGSKTDRPSFDKIRFPWKCHAQSSGTGALGDLASHRIHLVSWLVGQPERAAAQLRTFLCQRPEGPGGALVPVETDDHVIIQAAGPRGTIGTIEAGRVFTGPVNDMGIEIARSQG